MPGPWNLGNPPVRPGNYTNWRASAQQTIQPNQGSIVCVPFTHDWGPLAIPTLDFSWESWQQKFGSDDTPGSRAVKLAFLGEGLPGYGGAGAVLSYRFGATGTPPTAASITLNKTGPVAQLKLTAKYPGTRANRLNVTVRTNAANPSNQDLLIYDSQLLVEQYTYVSAPTDNTPMADLAAQINLLSKYVTAAVQADNALLLNVTNVSLTGGTDGATLLAADWTAAMAALSNERFGILVPFDNTDQAIQASFTTWVQGLNAAGRRIEMVCGGSLNETSSTAVTNAQTINTPEIVRVGVGGAVDFGVIGTPQAPVILSPSQMAPRVAGILAARGGAKSATYARVPGWDFRVTLPDGSSTVSVTAPTDADVVAAMSNGVLAFSRDSNPNSPMRIEKSVTTWQSSNTDANRPYKVYKNPRFIKIMQDFENALNEFVQNEVITPGLPMTQATKEFVLGRAQNILSTMSVGGLVQSGYQVGFDTSIPTSNTDDWLAVLYQWTFGRSVEQVRNTVVVA